MVSVLILKTLLNDEAEGVLSLHPFNDAEAAASEIDHLFFGIELIGFLELFQYAVKMCLLSRLLMLNGCYGYIEWTVAYRADETLPSSFFRVVILVPLVPSAIIFTQIPSPGRVNTPHPNKP
jgi:hypothetical protein